MEVTDLIKDFKTLSNKRKSLVLIFSLLTIFADIFVTFKILNFNNAYSLEIKILIITYLLLVITSLGYLSIYDIYHYSIPDKFTLILPIVMTLISIALIFAIGTQGELIFWDGNTITPLYSLLGGLAGILVIGLIVLATKGNGMGDGDIRIMAIIGLLVGINKLLIAFYITIFTALILGLTYSLLIKKFKGVPIPFVPFIALGGILTLILGLDNDVVLNLFRIVI